MLTPQILLAQSCLPEGIRFIRQTQVDSFPILYPNCTEIEGNVEITSTNDIVNLHGLNAVTAIGGELLMVDCNTLQSLNGLNNLQSIDGALSFVSNDNLINLTALQNLKSIGGHLTVSWNYRLKSLSGLDSIDAETIDNLHMIYNDSLSWCAILSICEYLANPNGNILLSNSIGCESVEVVEEFCSHVGISEKISETQLLAYPNPFSASTTIEYELKEISSIQFTVYNVIGEVVYTSEDRMMPQGRHTFTWSCESLPEGMYYGVLRSEEGASVVKMIKQ